MKSALPNWEKEKTKMLAGNNHWLLENQFQKRTWFI
jgi:hypothetical protein